MKKKRLIKSHRIISKYEIKTQIKRKGVLDSYFYGIQIKALFKLLFFLFMTFLLITSIQFLSPKFRQVHQVELKSSNKEIESKVTEIASQFFCACNECKEISLELCECDKAVEERIFIRKNVLAKEKKERVVNFVAQRYGFLKSEYANNYNVDKSQIWSNSN